MFEIPSRIPGTSQDVQATAWGYLGELEAMAQWLTDGPDSSPALASAVVCMDTFRGADTVVRWIHRVAGARTGHPGDTVASRLDAIVEGSGGHGPMTPEVIAEVSERFAVLEALCCIPDNYRCALLLKEGAGLTVERTARLMNVSKASLRSILYRARRSLAR